MPVNVLERISSFTPLGIRFWDSTLDKEVTDGLIVGAWPEAQMPPRPVFARRSGSGIYHVSGLPGLRDFETADDPATVPTPPRRFVVSVMDRAERFLPVAFAVDLPLAYRGLFLGPNSGIDPPLPGFELYPAPNRRRPTWLAAVRGELISAATGAPAPHAVVEVTAPDATIWSGIADAEGRFAVFLPWPAVPIVPQSTPPAAPAMTATLDDLFWQIDVQVRWDPAGLLALPGLLLPDVAEIMSQPAADAWADPQEDGGTPAASLPITLQFGVEAVARTTNSQSRLRIGAAPPSP
ncbi:MAG: hypothetical protein AAFN27_19275 [Pseudomonadota bacterium]